MNAHDKQLEIPLRSFAMKFFVAIFFFIFTSCNNSTNPSSAAADSAQKTSAILSTDSSVVKNDTTVKKDSGASSAGNAKTAANTPVIHGSVLYNVPWCGGAQPTPEMVEEMNKYKKLPDATLILRSGKEKYEISTDKDGNFSAAVPPGLYDLYLTKNISRKIHDVSPEHCENCLTQPIAKAKITANGKNELYFSFRCGLTDRMRP